MQDHTPSSNFTFSEKIDSDYIYNMYEDDYPYIESMFKTVLDHIDEDRDSIVTYYKEQQLDLLRKAVHKIKPAFGFVGMPAVLERCKSFENKCYQVASTEELAADYQELIAELQDATMIIANEHKKLVTYNLSAA
jgi:HPt (histidine-containing phosphotransfer) domain-containing protein